MVSVSIVALLFACGQKDSEDTGSNVVETPDFVGMDFILESSEGYQPISERVSLGFPSMDGELIALQFHAGCNGMGGSFLFDAGVVKLQELSMTEMGCEQSLMEEDDWFVNFWNSSPALSFSGDLLTVSDGTNTFNFRDSEVATPDLPLVDTLWVIDSFIEGDAVSNRALQVEPSVFFHPDGMIILETGCNSAGGSYSVSGATISVEIDSITEAECNDEMSREAENHMLEVFQGELSFSIDASRIELMNGTKGVSGTAQ
jgi:heat shock protein HslJ